MNKAQKRLVSSLAAASSVAAAIAPAATVFAATKDEAKALLDNAKKTLAFVDYNQAYAAIVALPAADQPALLAELTPLWDKVATKDVTDVLKTMEALAANKDLKNYYDLYDMIEKTVSLPRNQQYLMGELTSWGNSAVFTPDVTAATDALIKAWTDKTPANIAAAKDAIAKVTNAGSLAYLNSDVANLEKSVPVAVSSVVAKTASSFAIKFNKTVEDTTKVVPTVTRGTSTVTLTASWNTDKTELTLSSSSKLVQDTYKVNVKVADADLGTSEVKIEAEKVAKIEFLSQTAVRANDAEAYIPVRITNQYGDDITGSPLASNIQWTSSVDYVELQGKAGKLYVRKGTVGTPSVADLRYMPVVVVNGFDNTSGTYASASLKVSDTVGGVADITFKGVVDANGNAAELVAGSANKYYLQYDAVDSLGNKVDDFVTLSNQNVARFYSSFSNAANVTVERDPVNSSKALLAITVGPESAVSADMPVVFTGISLTSGKSSTLSVTVKKAPAVATFNVQTPEKQVAAGETVTIPFTAFDQNGNAIKEYTKLVGKISYSGVPQSDIFETRGANGDYVLKVKFASQTKYMFSATVPTTGKISTIQVDAKAPGVPTTLAAVTTSYPAMVAGASQTFDFYDDTLLTVKDQYDRAYDMVRGSLVGIAVGKYQVIAESSDVTKLTVNGGTTSSAINDGNLVLAVPSNATAGTVNVTFKLIYNNNGTLETKDTQTLRLQVVDKKDIASYAISSIANLYDTNESTQYSVSGALTDAGKEMRESVTAYGLLAGGTKVKLPSSMTIQKTTDNANFKIDGDGKIYVNNLGSNITTATANVYVSVVGNGGIISTASLAVNASKAAPVAAKVEAVVDYRNTTGSGVNQTTIDGDTISIAANDLNALTSIYKFKADGTKTNYNALGENAFYIKVTDQYGNVGLVPSYATLTQVSGANMSAGNAYTKSATINSNGVISWNDTDGNAGSTLGDQAASNDTFLLTVITTNGLTASYTISVR